MMNDHVSMSKAATLDTHDALTTDMGHTDRSSLCHEISQSILQHAQALMSACGHAIHGSVVMDCPCKGKSCLSALAADWCVKPSAIVLSNAVSLRATLHQLSCAPCGTKQLLIVPRRLLSRAPIAKLFHGLTPCHVFDKMTHAAELVGQLHVPVKRPSELRVYSWVTPPGLVAHSASITLQAQSKISEGQLDMIFDAHGDDGHPIRVLFDSGSTNTFVTRHMCSQLGLQAHTSQYKAVTTADGEHVNVIGQAAIPLNWGKPQCLRTMLPDVLILDSLLPGVDLIAGQDFLSREKAVLDFSIRQVTIGLGSSAHALSAGQPKSTSKRSQSKHSGGENHCDVSRPAPVVPCLSAAQANRFIRAGCPAFLCMVQSCDAPGSDALTAHMPDLSHVPENMRTQLQMVLQEHASMFRQELPSGLPPNVLPCEAIPLQPGATPVYRPGHRLSVLEREELDRQVSDLLSKGLIEPSSSPYGAPVLFVKKKDGTLRAVYDYRALNACTIRNRFPLPRIDDLIDSFRGATVFSALDMTSGYNQFRLLDSDVPRSAFVTPAGAFQWRVLSFGLTNAPSCFTHALSSILKPYIGKTVLLYLDDICIISRSPEEHIQHLREVLHTLQAHGIYLKLTKCQFFQSQIKYLGHIISKEGVRADPDKISALQNWQYPTSAHGMMQFLGLANYFHKFIPNFSRIAAPLYRLTQDRVPYSNEQQYVERFNMLKQALSNPPILAYPDNDKPYDLITDASLTGCGAVLVQEGKPIAYHASKFTSAEMNYTTYEQELLAVIKALKQWRCYLEGAKALTVHTDHSPLTAFSKTELLSRRQARWSEFLSRFKFEWKHRAGLGNPADALSRLHGELRSCSALATAADLDMNVVHRIPNSYSYDNDFKRDSFVKNLKYEYGFWWDRQRRIVVPCTMQQDIIKAHHDAMQAGHFGVDRTHELIARNFWWPKMRQDVKAYVASCPQCQRNKTSTQPPSGLLQPLQIPDTRWQVVTMDFITALPRTKHNHDAILVVVDKLTKMVHLCPTTDKCTAERAAHLFFTHVMRLHGTPQLLVSDRDTRFTSAFWRQLAKSIGTKHVYSTAYHPMTDGQTERTNRVVEEVLRNYTDNPRSRDWDDMLPFVEFAINNAQHASTGETPFFLNYGMHPRTPIFNQMPEAEKLPVLQNVLLSLEHTLERVQGLLQRAQYRQKSYADEHRQPHDFQAGQQVLLSTTNLRFVGKGSRKLYPRYIGPFTINNMVGLNAAELKLPETWTMHNVFHVSLLKPYVARLGASPPPLPPVEEGLPTYIPEVILAHRHNQSMGGKSRLEYLVKFQGLTDENNRWETAQRLPASLLQAYLKHTKLGALPEREEL